MADYLSNMTQEEFGSGNELPSTGFLIIGLLTLWTYTAWVYHSILKNHFKLRKSYFNSLMKDVALTADDEKIVNSIVDKGFTIQLYPKYISFCLYMLCLLIVIIQLVIFFIAHYSLAFYVEYLAIFDSYTKLASRYGVFIFCASTVFFLSWVCRSIRNHEYNELLFLRLAENPAEFKILQPSALFLRRWSNNQNLIALFLILSFPMILSPFFAVKHTYSIIDKGQELHNALIYWPILICVLGAIFHLCGTQLLLYMFNGHLRIEVVNMPEHISDLSFAAKASSTVLEDSTVDEVGNKGRALLPERSLSAIMMTDIVGFSRQMEADEALTYSKLIEHNRIIRSCIKAGKGEEIKTIGDAFLVKFKSAVDAVKSAINIQQHMTAYNSGKEKQEQIEIRIGIHIGDILILDGDVLGNGVNIVTRIQPLAEPGGICISADVYNVVKKSIDIKVINLGQKELKNIVDAPEIFKILINDNSDA